MKQSINCSGYNTFIVAVCEAIPKDYMGSANVHYVKLLPCCCFLFSSAVNSPEPEMVCSCPFYGNKAKVLFQRNIDRNIKHGSLPV